uniref:L,D-transpeptidase family protein n=1 Tax=Coprococcus sp. TaxID=2049024 RepID=UPI003FF110B0
MSEENKEVEQTENEADKGAERTETEVGKEAEQTECEADKEAEQTGAETEADKETEQTETQEIGTKDQPEVAATAAAVPPDVFVDKSVYEQIDKRKKGKKIAAIISVSVGGVILLCYLTLSIWFSFHFNKNTYIDGQNVSYHTVKSVKNTIDTYMSEYTLSVNGREHASFVIRPEDIDMTIQAVSNEKSIKKKQNGFLWFLYLNNKRKDYKTSYEVTYDKEKLYQFLKDQDCMQEKNMEKPKDAYVAVEKSEAVIVPETEGDYLDTDKVQEVVTMALEQVEDTVDLDEEACYENAEITADSKEIADRKKALETYLAVQIDYSIDRISWTLDASTFGSWLYYDNGKWKFKKKSVQAYVKQLAETYDTVGTTRTFQTYTGRYVEETGNRYGWAIDVEAETKGLREALASGKSQERTPEFSQTGAAYNKYGDIGYSYVEVDLSNQHVYLIIDGKLVEDSPCVTGCVKKGHGTPDGLYSITYKESPSVLRGEDYETKVNFWMPFNRGIGLHDATWRDKFGGDIYYSSGSHGCVNLPYQKAAVIYENIYAGMPVICYY